ncbi:hypothetical protein [Clostridium sp.]|uniref:hypothetical protein n=1 Tax=Clostridium sp. TaxID=1506 RepID=UPI002589280A|nr:hypothetical protein [Clostridium sp.]
MSGYRKYHETRDKSKIYPVKLIFDEDLNYSHTERTENASDKISNSSYENDYNTSTEFRLKEYTSTFTSTAKRKHRGKHKNIESKVLNSKVLSEIDPSLIPIKAPVIISVAKVYINVENKVELSSYATAIKHINRKVSLKKYTLIPKAKKLFLSGSIRKSIEYSEPTSKNNSTIEGGIKNITIFVPFKCVTDVTYIVDPDVQEKSSVNFVTLSKTGTKEETLSEAYNEVAPVYCEIVSIDFKELNIKEDIKPYAYKVPDIYTFKTLTQKMVMYLTVRLIQDQRIFIKAY